MLLDKFRKIVPINKTAFNYALIWRKFYADTIKGELKNSKYYIIKDELKNNKHYNKVCIGINTIINKFNAYIKKALKRVYL